MRAALIIGARPNIVKAAALLPAMRAAGMEVTVIHTGQHSDEKLSGNLMVELGVLPDVHLERLQGKMPGERLGWMIEKLSAWFIGTMCRYDLVIVVGDCDSTLAGALAAKKCGLRLAHVEAGLRAKDAEQENLNRIVVDHASDELFCSEANGLGNLMREGFVKSHICNSPGCAEQEIYVSSDNVYEVGNVMIDTLRKFEPQWRARASAYGPGEKYAVLTVHRAENTSDRESLRKVFMAIQPVLANMPVVFPVHPRTWNAMESDFCEIENLRFVDPLGYLDFCKLISEATVVLTDSGGVQEETTALGVPCLTLREQTERPSTISFGTNKLVGFDAKEVGRSLQEISAGAWSKQRGPALWDGHAAERIASLMMATVHVYVTNT